MSPGFPAIPNFCYFLQKVRRTWVAARDDDERNRLLKEDEGLAVRQLPKAAPELMRRYGFTEQHQLARPQNFFFGDRARFEVEMYELLAPAVQRIDPSPYGGQNHDVHTTQPYVV